MRTLTMLTAAAGLWTALGLSSMAEDLAAVTQPGAHVQRTMKWLEESTAQKRNTVRVLFYGQSITAGQWSKIVAEEFKRRWPNANLLIENRAIGGFTAPALIHTCEYDLYPNYPDLLIFHVYDSPGMATFDEIIHRVRSRTTAEIVLATHHDVGREADYEASKCIRQIAVKYQCGLVDIERQWQATMAREGTTIQDYLGSGVHHNARGAELYARMMSAFLVRDPSLPSEVAPAWITEIPAAAVKRLADGAMEVQFTGNRIDAVAAADAPAGLVAEVLLDGRKPSSFPETYTPTRPSPAPLVWWPAFKILDRQQPLVVEDWALRVLQSTPDGKDFRFRVSGSVTGEDGEGTNTQRFVSKSGRVVIDSAKGNWMIAGALAYRNSKGNKKVEMPADFEVKWQVVPRFVDRLEFPPPAGNGTERAVTLIQGIPNGSHTLRLVPAAGAKLDLRCLRVYRPPLAQ